MNFPHGGDDESVLVVSGEHGWVLTLAFRNGSPDSPLAKDMASIEEYRHTPQHLITACYPVDRCCVTVQTEPVCVLENASHVAAMADWLHKAAARMRELEDADGHAA